MILGVLCNSKLCIPSVQMLLQMGHKVFLCLPDQIVEDHFDIEQFAYQCGIPLTKVKKEVLDIDLVNWKERTGLDFIFVITFPYILSAQVIADINVDIINFHFAPLPQYRGAQPAFWIIKKGEKKGGVTAHVLTDKIDGGEVLHFEPYTLSECETFSSYLNNVSFLNTRVIQNVINRLSNRHWKNELKKQKSSKSVYYPKPQLEDIRINWLKMEAEEIERLCRACNPWNKGAIAVFNQQAIKLVEVGVLPYKSYQQPAGTIIRIKDSNRLVVCCVNNKCVDIKIVYHEQFGFFSNERLAQLGIEPGVILR